MYAMTVHAVADLVQCNLCHIVQMYERLSQVRLVGTEFLAKLDIGEKVTGEEMTQYFSPTEQQALIESDITKLLDSASQQIDPTSGKPFTGERLIERAAQMHFGGMGVPVDAAVSDVDGKISVKGYGEKTSAKYSQNLQSMGCF
jgi:hypothetical protein